MSFHTPTRDGAQLQIQFEHGDHQGHDEVVRPPPSEVVCYLSDAAANPASTSQAPRETIFDHVLSRQFGVRFGSSSWSPSGSSGSSGLSGLSRPAASSAPSAFHRIPPYTRFLRHLSCGPDNGPGKGTILCDAQGHVTSPVFAMKFSSGVRYHDMVALGDEEGYVSIIRVTDTVPCSLGDATDPFRPVGQWRAHKNAVFDLQWANNDRWMYCASGDTKLSLWDTGYASRIATFHSGRASVKALSVKVDNHNVFSSAGRDGDLYVHDVRVKEISSCERTVGEGTSEVRTAHRPVLKLDGPHSTVASTPGKAPKFGYARSGVTSLCFLDGSNSSILASGGQDGRIKLWDLRYTADPVVTHRALADQMEALSEALCEANERRSIHHMASMRQPPLSQRVRGVTSLSLHPDGSRLLASYIGGQHLLFDVHHPDHGPCQWFGGNLIDSFYVKSAFSPDGTHIISGSSDCNAYIWSLRDNEGTHPIVLTGHSRELTTVAWNPLDRFQIMTAGDDHVAKFWKVDFSSQPKEVVQEYDAYAVLEERAMNDALRRRQLRGGRDTGGSSTSSLAAGEAPQPRTEDDTRQNETQDVRTPLRVRNVLLEGPDRGSEKRKAAKQLTIAAALQQRQKRRSFGASED